DGGPARPGFGGSHRGRPAAPVSLCRRLCGHGHSDLLAAGARGVPRRVRASVGVFVSVRIRVGFGSAGLGSVGILGSRVLGSGILSRSACYRIVLGGVFAVLPSAVPGCIIGTGPIGPSALGGGGLGGGVLGADILPGVVAGGLLGIGGSGRRLATTDVLRFS